MTISISIEKFFQKRFTAFWVAMSIAGLVQIGLSRFLRCYDRGRCDAVICTSFDNLVEFTPIKPNASALLAIVDFHALPIAHHKRDLAHGAWHAAGCMCHFRKLQSGIFRLRAHQSD